MSQHYNYLLRNNSTVAGLDYSQVECLQRKRLLAFVNHFVSRTAHFLSTFTLQCDQRLDSINKKICRLENELALLEFKLDSVPHLKNSQPSDVPNSSPKSSLNSSGTERIGMQDVNPAQTLGPTNEDQNNKKPLETSTQNDDHVPLDNPAFAPFSKMASVGVPIAAITQKMKIQGFEDNTIKSFIDLHQSQK